MVIYTKRGDKGETSLYDPLSAQRVRVSKDSLKIKALGSIDELNSSIGVSRSFLENAEIDGILQKVQEDLLKIGSILAGSKLRFSLAKTKKLEKIIDQLESSLPVLGNFILPGGAKSASQIHLARSVSRRCERVVVRLSKKEKVATSILTYLNRLSDTLFMLARQINFQNNVKEDVWSGKGKRV